MSDTTPDSAHDTRAAYSVAPTPGSTIGGWSLFKGDVIVLHLSNRETAERFLADYTAPVPTVAEMDASAPVGATVPTLAEAVHNLEAQARQLEAVTHGVVAEADQLGAGFSQLADNLPHADTHNETTAQLRDE